MKRKIDFNNRATDQVAFHNMMNEKDEEKRKEKKSKRRNNIISFFFILVMIGSLNFISSISRFDNAKVMDKAFKQSIILGLSLVIFILMCSKKFGGLFNKSVSGPLFRFTFLVGSLILFIVVALGPSSIFPTVNGGKGWIRLGSLSLQIPELLKVPFVISIAGIFARGKDTNEKISYKKNFWTAFIYTGAFAAFITFALRDMGTAIHYVMIASFMLFLSDIPNRWLYPFFFGGILFSPVLLSLAAKLTSGYKQHRIKVYLEGILHNNYDRVDAYQIYQSLIAFGTGGIFGKGIGNGVQKYNYIPEVETDFAIANLAEETGFVGMFIVLFLFFTLFVLIISAGGSSILALSLSMGYIIYVNNNHTTD